MSCSTWFGTIILLAFMFTVNCDSKSDLYDNRETKSEVSAAKRPSFFVGSRYGRSQYYAPLGGGGRGLVNSVNIVPRNDKFFLGSRYGKRSDEYMQEVYDQEPSREFNGFVYMSCAYTGVKDFYRCYKGNENTHIEGAMANTNTDTETNK